MSLESANTAGNIQEAQIASTGPKLTSAGTANPYFFWISYVNNTGETVTREGVSYKKLEAYTSFAFDVLNCVIGGVTYNKMQYKYSATSAYGPFSNAITENSEVSWNLTGGTTTDNSGIPTYTYGGVTYTAQYTIKSDVYVPAEECATQCALRSYLNESEDTGDKFNKDLFVYKRKGLLRTSDMVVTGYGVVASDNVVDVNFGNGYFDIKTANTPVTTLATSAAAVAARVNQRASVSSTAEDGVYTLTQAN